MTIKNTTELKEIIKNKLSYFSGKLCMSELGILSIFWIFVVSTIVLLFLVSIYVTVLHSVTFFTFVYLVIIWVFLVLGSIWYLFKDKSDLTWFQRSTYENLFSFYPATITIILVLMVFSNVTTVVEPVISIKEVYSDKARFGMAVLRLQSETLTYDYERVILIRTGQKLEGNIIARELFGYVRPAYAELTIVPIK